MKRVFLIAALLLAGIFCTVAAHAAGGGTVTILYTGSVRGTLDPCAV